jgi:hypothetical protein
MEAILTDTLKKVPIYKGIATCLVAENIKQLNTLK